MTQSLAKNGTMHLYSRLLRYTTRASNVYGIVLTWPEEEILTLGSVKRTASTSITMLGDRQSTALQVNLSEL